MWDTHSIAACGHQCYPCFYHDSHNRDSVTKHLLHKYTMMYPSNTTKLYYVYYCISFVVFDGYIIVYLYMC